MITPSEGLPLAIPIVISFDVTSAYLQATLNDQHYYVIIEDDVLLDALKKLATGLGIPVPQLFTPPQRAQVTGRMAVTPSGQGALPTKTNARSGVVAEGTAAMPRTE